MVADMVTQNSFGSRNCGVIVMELVLLSMISINSSFMLNMVGLQCMANATRDPLVWAAVDTADQDVRASGDFCIRGHSPMRVL